MQSTAQNRATETGSDIAADRICIARFYTRVDFYGEYTYSAPNGLNDLKI